MARGRALGGIMDSDAFVAMSNDEENNILLSLIARHLGADWVARQAGPRLRSLTDGVSAGDWRFVAFVRLAGC